jgi:16S rRNA (guanine966-N2)-methyltransferase
MPRNHRSARHNAVQKAARPAATRGRNAVRIIGGRWRGRKVSFPAAAAIRPSPDRVRETLFNWLAPVIRGARCLDLFAGSGVLGLEALSRGAASAVLLDRDRAVVRHLRSCADSLGATGASVVEAEAMAWLDAGQGPYDIVFLDPPFDCGLMPGLLAKLDRPGGLAPGACVYIERPADEGAPALPPGWTLHRSGRAGDVGYYLAVRDGALAEGRSPDAAPHGQGGPTA